MEIIYKMMIGNFLKIKNLTWVIIINKITKKT